MKDISKPYRLAIFDALDGNISVPVFDEKKKATSHARLYVLLSTQQSQPFEETQGTFSRRASIDLEICARKDVEISKDDLGDIVDEILELLFPDYNTLNVTEPAGMQFQASYFDTEITRAFELSPTETIVRAIIKITSLIIQ